MPMIVIAGLIAGFLVMWAFKEDRDGFLTVVRNVLGECYKLKSIIVAMAACWLALAFYWPREGEEIPKWFTALYAVAKFGIGFCVAHLALKEAFPCLSLDEWMTKVRINLEDGNTDKGIIAAITLLAVALFKGIFYGVTIYTLAVW